MQKRRYVFDNGGHRAVARFRGSPCHVSRKQTISDRRERIFLRRRFNGKHVYNKRGSRYASGVQCRGEIGFID